jgi:hypothetical protein
MFAGGGAIGVGRNGQTDPSAMISHSGGAGTFGNGGSAFGASFCPNGPLTGKGGDLNEGAPQPGYVLLVW